MSASVKTNKSLISFIIEFVVEKTVVENKSGSCNFILIKSKMFPLDHKVEHELQKTPFFPQMLLVILRI